MSRLVRIAFVATDAVAAMLMTIGALAALATPFAMPAYAKMRGIEIGAMLVVWSVVSSVALVLGAYAVRTRRLLGVLLMSPVALFWPWKVQLIYSLGVVLFFGAPYLLVAYRMQNIRT